MPNNNTTTNQKQKGEPVKNEELLQQMLGADQGIFTTLALDRIEYSPLNYRKHYDQEELEQFAAELSNHGIIQSLLVRPLENGKYQIVIGERRHRAAIQAKLHEAPVRIVSLTDEQVIELQLAENQQRVNPHPMDEAQAVGTMQQRNMTIEEIALRLGKSKAFIYTRIKLLSLIEPFREMFYASKITIHDAVNIATLAEASQKELFDSNCANWKKQKDYQLNNLPYYLKQYKYELSNAPFDTKNKTLLPGVGACTHCPFNSATAKSLFPEYGKQATCSNKDCFRGKCTAQLVNNFTAAFEQHLPEALLFYGEPGKDFQTIQQIMPEAGELPRYDKYDVTIIEPPAMPNPDHYDDEEGGLDQERYEQDVDEYETELEEYQQLVNSKKILTGLLLANCKITPLQFSPEKRSAAGSKVYATSKSVQEAIREKTATPELLAGEIERLKEREQRSQTLDKEKIQLQVHEQCKVQLENKDAINKLKPTAEDKVAALLIIYESIHPSTKDQVKKVLFSAKDLSDKEKFYNRLSNLTPQESSYLVRQALLSKPESKYPNQVNGYVLYSVAKAAGTPINDIERQQSEKANKRQSKMKERVKDLQVRIKKMKPAA
ncbi:MAG: ParB/RepB/Spo0J family partition protein [Chitinophagaceae bacterium]|nr:MAG: ParB/RepB/Spo0J family partition protein [Chitinophagaceae bacterium]